MLSYGEIKKLEGIKNVALSPTICAMCGRQIYHIRDDFEYHYCRKCQVIKYIREYKKDDDYFEILFWLDKTVTFGRFYEIFDDADEHDINFQLDEIEWFSDGALIPAYYPDEVGTEGISDFLSKNPELSVDYEEMMDRYVENGDWEDES